jgi:small-conductance mechanosensitive channel
MSDSFRESLIWAVALAIVFPLFSVALTEATLRLQRARGALASPVALVRDLIMPALGALVLLIYIVGWTVSSTTVRIAETILWLFVTHTALSFVRAIMFANARENSWQARMPRLFIDMARGLIVLICLAIVLSTVWGQNLGKLVAALGVGSLVLGLALQEPVGNLFSGLMVMMERPIDLGNWVKVGDNVGAVIESNWRSVHLRTRDGDLVVVPNSILAKGSFVNYSRPAKLHSESIMIHFSDLDAPNRVKLVLIETARRTCGVLSDPAPKVRLANFEDSCIAYEVKLPINDFAQLKDIAEEFRTLVWYAARREGLTMPYPTQRHIIVPDSGLDEVQRERLPAEALKAFPHLGLAGSEVPKAVPGSVVKHYAKGEHVVREGQRLSGLHLIIRGRVALTARNAAGSEVEIARLERGEFFGEKALLSGAPSDATVTALEDLELLVLEIDSVHALIEQTPNLSQQIGEVMEARRKALQIARSKSNGT